MVRIKICGLTDPAEARATAEAGADAIGLVFAKSPRKVSLEQAREIVFALPPLVQSVGVFVNETPGRIEEAVAFCGLDLVQLHGDEPPELCAALAPRVIKAWRVRGEADIEALRVYEHTVRAFVLDAWSSKVRGGTGDTFDWSLAATANQRLQRPIVLAGGLNPENVSLAIGQARPWGVDVSSGVEAAPGRKDPARVERFIRAVRSCETRRD